MGRNFKQVTPEDRVAISSLLRAGISKEMIAKQLGFHRSSIYRELARNGTKHGYLPFIAERKLYERRKRHIKLQNKYLKNYIFDKLKQSWSPEQIAGRLKLENNGKNVICHETIYTYLYSDYGIRNKYYKFLRRKRQWRYPRISRKKRIKIPNRVSIHERSAEINQRQTLGHWECDLVHFGKKTKTNLITLRERYSRYMIAIKNPTRQAETTAKKIITALNDFNSKKVQSITFDNGFEFTHHEQIAEQLEAKTYFCDPYKSYQKGTIENGNKQLREWLPSESAIDLITQQKVNYRVNLVNRRPMKCLGYKTPCEIFKTTK